MTKKKNKNEIYVPIKYLNQDWQPGNSFESGPGALLYTALGFLTIASVLAAVYWWYLSPRYDLLTPKHLREVVVLPSAAPEVKPEDDTPVLLKLSPDDDPAVIQAELEETKVPDFSDDFERLKMMLDRL